MTPRVQGDKVTRAKNRNARIIENEKDIRAGVRALTKACPHMRAAHEASGMPPLRRRLGGFEGLARIVVGQQVSVASAAAIWGRFVEAAKPFEARRVLRMSDDDMREAGLSRPKIKTLRAVAAAVNDGLDLDQLAALDDAEVRARLVAISGIGPWTSDVYLMFCIGRADAFASGDLALQEAARLLMGLDARPGPDELEAIAERWRPWRGVAARLLWSYYQVAKAQKSGVPV
jgi:DNA-3-methyladenine glycosylase II